MIDSRLGYVIAVSREGSFTAAAASLGVTQASVSKSVAALELEIGYPIFHRGKRGATPTEEGRDFIEQAARLMDDARDLLRRNAGRGDPYARRLVVGVCPASLEWQIVDAVQSLLAKHPSVKLQVIGSSFERMVQQLRNGAVDLAVGFDEAFSEWPELGRQPVGELRSTLFVRRGHPLLGQKRLSLSHLANFDFVSPSDSKPYGGKIREIYESNDVDHRRRLHVLDYFPAMARIVRHTDAIGMVNRAYARSKSFERYFAVLEHPDFFPPARLCCAYRLRREISAPARAFVTALKTSASRLS